MIPMLKMVLVGLIAASGCSSSDDGEEMVTRMEAAHAVASLYCADESGDARYACEWGVLHRVCGDGCIADALVPASALDRCAADIRPMRFPDSCLVLF